MDGENSDPIDELLDSVKDFVGDHRQHEVEVVVTCPKCGKSGSILVDRRSVEESPGKVFNYGVVAGTICPHSFLTGIDSSMTAR